MAVLVDWQIAERCQQDAMVTPFDADMLNCDSLDIRLGSMVLVEVPALPQRGAVAAEHRYAQRTWQEATLTERPFYLYPGLFLLAASLEAFRLPEEVAAQFHLRSSLAREGYGHSLAGWCHAGWEGVLTLELHNHSGTPLPLVAGMRIGQLTFLCLDAIPERPYAASGRYQGAATVEQARHAAT